MGKSLNGITNCLSGVINYTLATGCEWAQYFAKRGTIEYQPFMGYLSDVAAPAALTSITLLVLGGTSENVKLERSIPVFYASLLTAAEIGEKFTNFNLNGGTYDPYDIACYWAGAGLAFGLHKLTSD